MPRRPTLSSLHRDIFGLTQLVTHIHGMVHTMAKTIQEIETQLAELNESVEAETSLDDSIIALLEGQGKVLAGVQQQLADLIAAGGGDPEGLQEVSDALTTILETNEANKTKIAEAIAKNTPVA
jgi:hypothetical protein